MLKFMARAQPSASLRHTQIYNVSDTQQHLICRAGHRALWLAAYPTWADAVAA